MSLETEPRAGETEPRAGETEPRAGETEPRAGDSVGDEREAARRRLQARRDLGSHLVAYVVINAFLIGAWALTGGGYFWPAWILAGWGVGLVLHAWDTFVRKPVTEADVDTELHRQRR